MSENLRQSDFDDLSAWLDGELAPARAEQIERLVRDDPAWARAAEDLRSLDAALDGFPAPAPDVGLAGRILDVVRDSELTEEQVEQLSAYLDGELEPEPARAVAAKLHSNPAWREALRELQGVEALLDHYTVPAAEADLPRRVAESVRSRQRRRTLRVGAWLAPVAAAALVLIGVALMDAWRPPADTGGNSGENIAKVEISPELQKSAAFKNVPAGERPALQDEIIRHLDFFQDYEVVADLETLREIERLDSEPRGI